MEEKLALADQQYAQRYNDVKRRAQEPHERVHLDFNNNERVGIEFLDTDDEMMKLNDDFDEEEEEEELDGRPTARRRGRGDVDGSSMAG